MLELDQEDVTLKNLEGKGAIEVAERWAESRKMVRTLELLSEYLTGREREFVDLVLRRVGGTTGAPDALGHNKSRIQAGGGIGYLRRYSDGDEDTDSSDAEDARGRTAHQLFADQAGDEGENPWRSFSQSINDQSIDFRHSPASPKRAVPLTTSSPIRTGTGTQDNGKRRRVSRPDIAPNMRTPPSKPGSPMQMSPPTYPSDSALSTNPANHHLQHPLADVNNLLGKRPIPHISSRSPTPSSSPTEMQQYHKRRRTDMQKPTMENQSPISDHSVPAGSDGSAVRSTRTASRARFTAPTHLVSQGVCPPLHPPPALPSGYSLSHSATEIPIPLSRHNWATMVSDVSTTTERFQIADKLARARPDLVVPSYPLKRIQQTSWSILRPDVREGRRDNLHPNFHTTMVVQSAAPGHSLPSEDVLEDDSGVDWERSRMLANRVLAQLEKGEPVSLPALACLNSQVPDAP